jgi:hypothetical protein
MVSTRFRNNARAMALGVVAAIVPAILSGGPGSAHDRVIGRSLESVFERCWERPWEDWRAPTKRVPRPAHLHAYNPSSDVTLHVCFFDAICRRILYSGRVLPRSILRLNACTDEDSGLVYVIFERNQVYRLDDLHSSFKKRITLPVHEGYYPP